MERRSKGDDSFSALGDTDELNAAIGVARAHCQETRHTDCHWHSHSQCQGGASPSDSPSSSASYAATRAHLQIGDQLAEIQSRLFDIGAHLATPRTASNEAQIHRTNFDDQHVDQLEQWIDGMEAELPPLKNFILPSGGLLATQLHVCRAVCRRAERSTVPLVERGDSEPIAQKYLNRLSDYLFVAARYAALTSNAQETIWKKPREPRQKRDTTAEAESHDAKPIN